MLFYALSCAKRASGCLWFVAHFVQNDLIAQKF